MSTRVPTNPPTNAAHASASTIPDSPNPSGGANCSNDRTVRLTQPPYNYLSLTARKGAEVGARRRGGDRPERGGAAGPVPAVARPGRAPDRIRRFRVGRRQPRPSRVAGSGSREPRPVGPVHGGAGPERGPR